MTTLAAETLSERLPTTDETLAASEAITALARALTDEGALPIATGGDDAEIRIELPPAIGRAILDLLAHIARGEMVTLVPYGAVLTTQRAADLLNVSRPFLTKLLEAGEIPFHRVGAHRRVRVEDLLAYREHRDHERGTALGDLQRMGQDFDAG